MLRRLYIYGGNDIREGTLNSLWCFDLSKIGSLKDEANAARENEALTMEWRKLETHGTGPGKQAAVQASLLSPLM